ncbi:MAG TPA: RNA polymerase-binding protein RbpA [Rhodoglobus sp.]|nr:RNA polymerase-binding protein RbpA [Rhodoglobus sp.]
MADRSLRGMRLGTQSLQSEEGVEFSPRKRSIYRTADGETFEVVFAADAEVPQTWESPKSGREGVLLTGEGEPVERDQADAKTPRSHWDMLLERRSRAELEELLQERLEYLRSRRGQGNKKEQIGA